MLALVQKSHQGLVHTQQRTRLTIYWPVIDNNIDKAILACKKCQDYISSNNKEPIISKLKQNRPIQEVAGNFCSYAVQDYLVLMDCTLTAWPDIIPMGHDTTVPHLIKVVRQSFCHTGVPNTFWSDEGPHNHMTAHDTITRSC